jgi:hypothetical protein
MDFKELLNDSDSKGSHKLMVTPWPQEYLVLQVVVKIQVEYLNKRRCMVEWEVRQVFNGAFQCLKLMSRKISFTWEEVYQEKLGQL